MKPTIQKRELSAEELDEAINSFSIYYNITIIDRVTLKNCLDNDYKVNTVKYQSDGYSSLILALRYNRFEAVNRLLDSNVINVRVIDPCEKKPAYEILMSKTDERAIDEILPRFVEKVKASDLPIVIDKLEYCFRVASTKQLKVLLDSRIDVRVREKLGIDLRTAVFGNCRIDDDDPMKILRNYDNNDFDVNAKGLKQRSALHYAVRYNLRGYVQYLLDAGANVNVQNEEGCTALFYAAREGRIDIVILLLEYGADVNIQNRPGWTALYYAVREARYDIVILLLEYGADLQFVSNYGHTGFEVLAENSSTFVRFLLVGQLALEHDRGGLPIKQAIQNRIDSDDRLRNMYESCCQQLQALKKCKIVDFITMYDLINDNVDMCSPILRNQDFVCLLDQYKIQYNLNDFYYFKLENKLIEISNLYAFHCSLAGVISNNIGKSISFDHLIVREISKWITRIDRDEFVKCCK